MNDIERINKMIAILRDMKKDIARQDKLNTVNGFELTAKQAQKRDANLNQISIAQINAAITYTLML